jgi:hypothetical protein
MKTSIDGSGADHLPPAGGVWSLWAFLGRGLTFALAVAAHAFGCRHRFVADRWTSALVRFPNVGRFSNAS